MTHAVRCSSSPAPSLSACSGPRSHARESPRRKLYGWAGSSLVAGRTLQT